MKRALFLGTGGSAGVPMIGCRCAVCQSTDPLNRRLRPSLLLEMEGKKLLIDVGPDFRSQALTFGIDHLDGVLLTHSHSDHVAGIDELRVFYLKTKEKLPILTSKSTSTALEQRFPYLFQKRENGSSLSAQLEVTLLEKERGSLFFCELPIQYFTYEQGGMKVTGFRFQDFAYVVDIRTFPESIFEDLKGVKTLVLSALGPKSSYMHLSFQEAIDFIEKVGATQSYITHLSHEVEYTAASKFFPKAIALAYDGLSLEEI